MIKLGLKHIRTKIIGGYLLFVVLILSFLGLNQWLVSSTVNTVEEVHEASEEIRLEMEAENILWRQVGAMTDYFLFGDPKYFAEFHAHSQKFNERLDALGDAADDEPEERDQLRNLPGQYALFMAKFEKAAKLHQSGLKAEVIKIEIEEIDPAEHELERALESLIELESEELEEAIEEVRSAKTYARLFPFLSTTSENAEAVYAESRALQRLLDAEAAFRKQVIYLTDLFLIDNLQYADKFHEQGKLFRKLLEEEKTFVRRDDERELLFELDRKHQSFLEAFARTEIVYRAGDKAGALKIERQEVDPIERELETLFSRYYPLRRQSMERALANVELIDAEAVSVTRNFGIYVFILLIVGLTLGIANAVRITRPVAELAGGLKQVAAGDFQIRTEIKSRDEIGALADSFNRMAEALQKTTVSKDYVNSIFESMIDSLVVVSPEGIIQTVNAATCALLGYAEDELIGHRLELIFPHDESFQELIVELIQKERANIEKSYYTKDSRRIPVSLSGSVMRDASGELQALVCVAQDITERKLAEEELSRLNNEIESQRQRLNNVLTHVPGVVWEVWGDPAFLHNQFVSDYVEKMLGYTTEEWLSRIDFWLRIIHPEDRARVEREASANFASGKGGTLEFRWITKDARVIWVESNCAVIVDVEGRPVGVRGVTTDITARKHAEDELRRAKQDLEVRVAERTSELSEANERLQVELEERKRIEIELAHARDAALESARVKSEFLANMSHEIRTPMNGIIGMTELTLDTDLNAEQRDYLQMVKYSADSLLDIINDILDFSKIEAGRFELNAMDFDLTETVGDVLRPFIVNAQQKGLELTYVVDRNVPSQVVGDATRLRQILLNLVGNAIKFTEAGRVSVSVEKESETGNKVSLHFAVKDTGIGIPREKHSLIFEPFQQADGSTTRKYGGTGLGLSITSKLVQLMGGRLWLGSPEHSTDSDSKNAEDSSIGPGSIFHFTVRLNLSDRATKRRALLPGQRREVPSRSAASSATSPVNANRPLHILVAEDNVINQRLAVSLLTNRGHRVELVSNGKQAVELLAQKKFDLVLMDVQMPEMNGFDATLAIRAREEKEGRHTPIIAMTAYAMKGDRETCLAAGMDDYISKPIKADKLLQLIDHSTTKSPGFEIDATDEAQGYTELDFEALVIRAGGDEQLARELVQIFLDDYPKILAQIREAIASNDPVALERAAHTAKGALGYFSHGPVVTAALRLQQIGASGDLGGAPATMAELEALIEQLKPSLIALGKEYV